MTASDAASLALWTLGVLLLIHTSFAVNWSRQGKLSKQQLLQLDWDVSQFYSQTLNQLDSSQDSSFFNATQYDAYLFRALRSFRHTMVANLLEFKYSSERLMEEAQGSRVDSNLCETQLSVLLSLAQRVWNNSDQANGINYTRAGVSMSVLQLLESSGRVESGLLNGNSFWWGQYSGCVHSSVPSELLRTDWPAHLANQPKSITGRYCVAHLYARSWPNNDPYFGDRINIRLALCLPDSCHSLSYHHSANVRHLVDQLARKPLLAPFNSDRYHIRDLYCLPDEDSSMRQPDLGTKLLILFLIGWASVLAYAAYRHWHRLQSVRCLRRPQADIRLLVRGQPNDETSGAMKQASESNQIESSIQRDHASPNISDQREKLEQKLRPKPALDLVAAFAIQANLAHLFKKRQESGQERNPAQANVSSDSTRGRRSSQLTLCTQSQTQARTCKPNNRASGCESRNSSPTPDESQSSTQLQQQQQQHQSQQLQPIEIPSRRVCIDIFDGIKVLSTIYIVMGHVLMFFYSYVTDLRFSTERMHDLTMISMINALQVVGLFYIITGLLLTYLAFSRQGRRRLTRPSFWLLVIVGRYLRLIPLYLLVFWFVRHASPLLGSGAHWVDYRTDYEHPRYNCGQQSWWIPLTFSAADVKIPFDCLPQTWYLSNDFRSLFILPFYIMALAIKPSAGYAAILATFVYSGAKITSILRDANVDYLLLLKWQPHVYALFTDRLHDVYTTLSIRLSTNLLGVVVGHLIYQYETGQIEKWPKWFRTYGLKVSVVIGLIIYFGAALIANPFVNQFLPSVSEFNSDSIVYLIPIFKAGMEICLAVTMLSLATGGGTTWLKELLSSRLAKILSNISYGVFLIHVEVMYKTPGIKFESNYYLLFVYGIFAVVVSYAIALILYLLFEMPINNMLRYLTKRALNYVSK